MASVAVRAAEYDCIGHDSGLCDVCCGIAWVVNFYCVDHIIDIIVVNRTSSRV